MDDCRQLENASGVENVHMVTEILSQVLSGSVTSLTVLPSLNNVVPLAFGAPKPKGTTLYDFISYVHMRTLLLPTLPCIPPAVPQWTHS